MTASVTFSPRWSSAAFLSFIRTRAEISGGVSFLPRISISASPLELRTTLYGTRFASCPTSSNRRPMKRFTE